MFRNVNGKESVSADSKKKDSSRDNIGVARQGDPISNLPKIIVTETNDQSLKNDNSDNNGNDKNDNQGNGDKNTNEKNNLQTTQNTSKETGEPDVQASGQSFGTTTHTEHFDPSAPPHIPVKLILFVVTLARRQVYSLFFNIYVFCFSGMECSVEFETESSKYADCTDACETSNASIGEWKSI